MTASAIFSPNPRGLAPPLDSPLILKGSPGSPAPPISMTASAIFSPNPRGGSGVLPHLAESPPAIKGTDLRQVASAEADSPPVAKLYNKINDKARRSSAPPPLQPPPPPQPLAAARRRDIPPPEPVPPPAVGRTRRATTNYSAESPPET